MLDLLSEGRQYWMMMYVGVQYLSIANHHVVVSWEDKVTETLYDELLFALPSA